MTREHHDDDARSSRIAVVFDCFYPISTGGGERLYREFSESFARAGHRVDYLTRQQWVGPAPHVDGVDVRAVSGPTDLYDGTGSRRLLPAVSFAWGVFRHLVAHRSTYDAVLVSALPVLNVFAARLALLGSRTRMCSDFLEVWRRENWIEYSGPVVGRVVAGLQTLAVRASPLASCHARLTADRLVDAGLSTPPIVSPGLIPPNHSADGLVVSLAAPTPPVVVYAGRHIPDKQVDVIPAAVAWARQELPDLRAVILGDGQQRDAVRAAVARCGLEGVVELPGFVSEAELEEQMRGAAVFVNPSRREGYGLVVVEACAVGTPVVLVEAAENAAVELIEAGTNGYVAASTRPDVLGAAIVRAVRGGAELRATTRAWFEVAVQERTMEAAAQQILTHLLNRGTRLSAGAADVS